jgi:glycosyltransferase involved in cell wall biosynthesis
VLTILSVAYPLARVGPDAVGGAEQVLNLLDAAIHAAGHRSLVVACEGSRCAGELVAVPSQRGPLEGATITAARARHRGAIERAVQGRRVDVVHMHGVDFDAYLPPEGVPVLATLHCPPDWYGARALAPQRPGTYLNAVSWDQHCRLEGNPRLLQPIENGVPIEAFAGQYRRRGFVLMLSRIAPEKGIPLALEAARAARLPLLVAGELFPYPEHTRYFAQEVAPRLDRERRWIGPVGLAAKRLLLGSARCLIVCSQVPETSSLAAREALAAGTPVVALRGGALAEVVVHGRTGLLVDEAGELAEALQHAGKLDAGACRRTARERFDAGAMAQRYLQVYERLAGRTGLEAVTAGAA